MMVGLADAVIGVAVALLNATAGHRTDASALDINAGTLPYQSAVGHRRARGEPDTTENPKPGEINYTDTTSVLTRHWSHRDAHRTRVTKDSTHVAFVLETLHATRDGHRLKTAAGELQDLLTEHSVQSTVHYLSPANLHRTV